MPEDTNAFMQQQFGNLERKLDQLTRDLAATEATLRKDLQTQFVTRVEYEPRHQQLVAKIAEIDRFMLDAEQNFRKQAVLENNVQTLQIAYNELENRQRGIGRSALGWISLAVAALGVLLNFFQHIQVK